MSAPPNQEEEKAKGVKLPQALEKVLAFKDVRAQQLGINPEEDSMNIEGRYNEVPTELII